MLRFVGRPEGGIEPMLELRERREIAPGSAGEKRGDGGAVDSGRLLHFPQRPLSDRLPKPEGDESGGLSGRVVALPQRPVGAEVRRVRSGWSGHRPSLERIRTHSRVPAPFARELAYIGDTYHHPGDGRSAVSHFAESYRPKMPPAVWARIKPICVTAVEATPIESDKGKFDTLRATASLVRWCTETAGFDLDPEILFTRPTVAYFVENGMAHTTEATRGNWTSLLLRVCAANNPTDADLIQVPRHSKSDPSAPYTPEEIDVLYRWARGQNTELRVRSLSLSLSLGLGAGIDGGELRFLRTRDVTIDADGVLVTINCVKRRSREVPVLRSWEELVRTSIPWEEGPDSWAFRPGCKRDANVVNSFIANLPKATTARGRTVPLSGRRLRATWIVGHLAAGTPAPLLAEVAGLESFRGLERYLPFLPKPDRIRARRTFRDAPVNQR